MTPHQFIALTVRLFALWLLLTGAQVGLLAYAMRSAARHGGEASFVLAAIYLLLAGLLWVFPLGVARRLLPRQAAEAASNVDATDAAAVAFVTAGLLIISLKALTPVANYLSLLAMLLIGGTLVIRCRALARRVLPPSAATPSR